MFVLKIIVFSSALLNVGLSTAECDPDQTIQFQCRDQACKMAGEFDGIGDARDYSTKKSVSVIGFNENTYLVHKKEKLQTVTIREIKINNLSDFSKTNFPFKVSINKQTLEICKSSNKENGENRNDENIGNETDDNKSLQLDNNTTENPDNVNAYEENNETKESSNNIFSVNTEVNTDSSIQQNNDNSSATQQIQKIVDSSTNGPINNVQDDNGTEKYNKTQEQENKNSDSSQDTTEVGNQQSNNNDGHKKLPEIEMKNVGDVINLQSDNNATENLNTDSSIQQNNDNSSATQQIPKIVDSSTNGPINNVQDNNNVTEKYNKTQEQENKNSDSSQDTTEVGNQQSNNNDGHRKLPEKEMKNVGDVINLQSDNNATENLNTDSSIQQNNDNSSATQQIPKIVDSSTNGPINNVQDDNNGTGEYNKIQEQENKNSDSSQDTTETGNQQNNESDIKKEKADKNDSDIKNNALYGNSIKDNSQNYSNSSTVNETPKQLDVGNGIKETKSDLSMLNHGKELETPNISINNFPNEKSTISNNDSVNGNIRDETDIVPSSDDQTTVNGQVKQFNKEPIDQCTSESECSHLMDSTINGYESNQYQYKPENKVLPYENSHTTVVMNNNDKSKEFKPKSFVASFGHPDTCIGINCMNSKRNTKKIIKAPQSLDLVQQFDPETISHPTNAQFDIENKIIIDDITEHSDVELSILDNFQNWLSSPSLNSIDFLWNIFGEYSNKYDTYPDQTLGNQGMLVHSKHINHSELYFIVVAVVTLLFSLIYYKYQRETYESHLLTLLSAKDQSLLIVEKELSLLKEQSFGNTRSTERNLEIETLNEHMTKSEDIISSQALRIEKLEQEVEELTESGMEMHTLLSSALESSTKSTDKLNTFKVKLVNSENLVAALTQKNFDKTTELEKINDIIKTLRTTVEELTNKNNSLVEDNGKLSSQLEQIVSRNTSKESKLLREIKSLKFELDKQTNNFLTANNEVLLSKDALQEMLSQKFNPVDAKKYLSSVKLSAELKSVKHMCEGYKQKLDEVYKTNQQHLDHTDVLKNNIVNLEDNISKLEKKNEESLNKLNILTMFFKEQEKDYLKQINEKEILFDNKEWESSDLNERVKSLNQEITNYKLEIQSLKKEITDQEASFKIQISAADKKASDYWISFRQAERKLKEMELETSQLRNKLTMVDKKLENGSKSIDSSKDFEEELLDIPLPTVSPDFTLLDFEPPPPILTNERLPPLGALGQAPSPPVPLSRRHNRSLSPGSPPPSQRTSAFRPFPQRYNYMNRQNSLGHSDESLNK